MALTARLEPSALVAAEKVDAQTAAGSSRTWPPPSCRRRQHELGRFPVPGPGRGKGRPGFRALSGTAGLGHAVFLNLRVSRKRAKTCILRRRQVQGDSASSRSGPDIPANGSEWVYIGLRRAAAPRISCRGRTHDTQRTCSTPTPKNGEDRRRHRSGGITTSPGAARRHHLRGYEQGRDRVRGRPGKAPWSRSRPTAILYCPYPAM